MLLETDRLSLAVPSVDHFEGYRGLWGDEPPEFEGMPHFPALRQEEVLTRLLRAIGQWTVYGFGPFMVFERASGAVVGEVGFSWIRRDIAPGFDEAPEAMWKIHRRLRGLGIAREALEAAIGWFDREHGPQRTVCMIDAPNVPSLKLAEQFGYRPFASGLYSGNAVLLLERP
jgi:RimJ/RimL family protein N-acetyltransferase